VTDPFQAPAQKDKRETGEDDDDSPRKLFSSKEIN